MASLRSYMCRWHSRVVKRYVTLILANPKAFIIIPLVLVFVLSYNVLYEYFIKSFNYELQWRFTDRHVVTESHVPQLHRNVQHLSQYFTQILKDLSTADIPMDFLLLKILITDNYNCLSYDNLQNISSTISHIARHTLTMVNSSNHSTSMKPIFQPVVVLPLDFWPVDFFTNNIPSFKKRLYIDNVFKFINSKDSILLNTFFLQDVCQTNNLISSLREISFYVLLDGPQTSNNEPTPAWLVEILDSSVIMDSYTVITTHNKVTIVDFIDKISFRIEPGYNLMKWSITSLTGLFFIKAMFYVILLITILNQYKIRLKLGLLVGWAVQVTITTSLAIILTANLYHISWKDMWEPQTNFSMLAFVLILLFVSASNMLATTTFLLGDNNKADNQLKKKLFQWFTGGGAMPNMVQSDFYLAGAIELNQFNSHKVIPASAAKIRMNSTKFFIDCVPFVMKYIYFLSPTAKATILTTSELFFMRFVSSLVVKWYMTSMGFASESRDFIQGRIEFYISTLIAAVLIDHLLQVTYLTSIILVDLTRFEFTDLLALIGLTNTEEETQENSLALNSHSEAIGVNRLLRYLLKLDCQPNFRPLRSSYRHWLGQFLLKIKAPLTSCQYVVISLILISVLLVFTVALWFAITPLSMINDTLGIYRGSVNVVSRKYNIIYYLELCCVVMVILAVTGLSFKFTYQDSHVATKLSRGSSTSDQEFGVTDEEDGLLEKNFSLIDLIRGGHTLDVLRVKTNSSSPFIVTIGLDHKVLIWLPLNKPNTPAPINISSIDLRTGKEFWPINHVSISDEGNYIILLNFATKGVKCYGRKQLRFIWDKEIPEWNTNHKILELFFRRRTVPGYLTRKIMQRKKAAARNEQGLRRGSVSSQRSMASSMNGNYQAPLIISEAQGGEDSSNEIENREDYMCVCESGNITTVSCSDGLCSTTNILEQVYDDISEKRLVSALKLSTARVCDRIVCLVNNNDIVVVSLLNNKLQVRKLSVQKNFYNSGMMVPLSPQNYYKDTNDFKSIAMANDKRHKFHNLGLMAGGGGYKLANFLPSLVLEELIPFTENGSVNGNGFSGTSSEGSSNGYAHRDVFPHKPDFQLNRPVIATVQFVGMVIRVRGVTAELIDIQTGIVLKLFQIGHFKANSFRVVHSEPTHCKFCGCALVQSMSLIYQDLELNTLIVHTFTIDAKKLKNNICLRVERDPREIRCLGFNAVTEHLHWYENIEKWEVTDINMIIGIRRRKRVGEDEENDVQNITPSNSNHSGVQRFDDIVARSGLTQLRTSVTNNKGYGSPKTQSASDKGDKEKAKSLQDSWEGFIVNVKSGVLMEYAIPLDNASQLLLNVNKVVCMEKFGYKSVVVSFGNLVQVLYLGSDKLIEKDLYFLGTNTNIRLVLPLTDVNVGGTNNGLLFINKRRMYRERNMRTKEAGLGV